MSRTPRKAKSRAKAAGSLLLAAGAGSAITYLIARSARQQALQRADYNLEEARVQLNDERANRAWSEAERLRMEEALNGGHGHQSASAATLRRKISKLQKDLRDATRVQERAAQQIQRLTEQRFQQRMQPFIQGVSPDLSVAQRDEQIRLESVRLSRELQASNAAFRRGLYTANELAEEEAADEAAAREREQFDRHGMYESRYAGVVARYDARTSASAFQLRNVAMGSTNPADYADELDGTDGVMTTSLHRDQTVYIQAERAGDRVTVLYNFPTLIRVLQQTRPECPYRPGVPLTMDIVRRVPDVIVDRILHRAGA